MTLPSDMQETVSRELSIVIQAVIDNYEAQGHGPATLGSVRAAMAGGVLERLTEEGRVNADDGPSLYSELDALTESFGADTAADGFTRPRASEDLSTVIEALLDELDEGAPPTLAAVRDAMNGGLLAKLVGHGEIDSEDEQTLTEEIEEMIAIHGPGALAEDFLRYY